MLDNVMTSRYPTFRLLWSILVAVSAAAFRLVAAEGDEVLVIYNSRVADSKAVAQYYARKRAVPDSQVVGFDLPDGGSISRSDYTTLLQQPLLDWMSTNGLAVWTRDQVPSGGPVSAGTRYTLVRSRIRYLVPCFGIPWYIQHDAALVEGTNGLPGVLNRNDACLDQDLCLLPRIGHFRWAGMTGNPFGNSTNASEMQPTKGAFIVTRLDGPTPDIARSIVDKAIEAEARGLWGHAYIDLRSIKDGPYQRGDVMITNAATAAKRLGFETFVDTKPETLGVGYPMSQIGLYVGWYESHIVGPFVAPEMEFLPGAFAYHLHSYSGANVRSRDENWIGPMLARGVTCTMGCVAEPYLDFTPHPGVFLERWGYLGMTFGEAAMTCHPVLSWQTVVIGDPLYRPFRLTPLQYGEMLSLANSPLTAYALVRKVNVDILNGRVPVKGPAPAVPSRIPLTPSQVVDRNLEMLEAQPMASQSAIVSEKIARLYWNQSRAAKAATWYSNALAAADCTPRQRVRLLLDAVEAYRVMDKPRAAFEALDKVMEIDPDRSDRQTVRTHQLHFARDMRDRAAQERIQAELQRLAGTNAVPK